MLKPKAQFIAEEVFVSESKTKMRGKKEGSDGSQLTGGGEEGVKMACAVNPCGCGITHLSLSTKGRLQLLSKRNV